ncbi:copper amine oxidase N-terminal domain-containing protein [Coprothermobacteraceae bacterium]|nr:copper amine oxidase N-terminal domain-containing protein [Coprothermobacteraceae bacterium]
MRKALALLVLALMLVTGVRAQVPLEQRWFNYRPIAEVGSGASTGDGLIAFDGSRLLLPGGATLVPPVGLVDVAYAEGKILAMTVTGSVFQLTASNWVELGLFDGMSKNSDGVWLWTSTIARYLSDSGVTTLDVPLGTSFVSGTPTRALVVAGWCVYACTNGTCEELEGKACTAAWDVRGQLACYRPGVLEVGDRLFEYVSSVSQFGSSLYFISGTSLYAYSGELSLVGQVGPGSFLEGDCVITPAGTFRLDGYSLTKISNRMRSPISERLTAGPSLVGDNYRLTYTASAWTEYFAGEISWRREGLLLWEPGSNVYLWDNTLRTVRGEIVDGMGDDQEGYLIVKEEPASAEGFALNMWAPASRALLVYDAVTGKPLVRLSTLVSYGYTGRHYYVATSNELKLFSLGSVSSMRAVTPPQGVVEWSGNLYYWSQNYLIGPKVYRFPNHVVKAVAHPNGILVLTSSTLYLVSDAQVFDMGASYGGLPKDAFDVVVDGESVYVLSRSGVYGVLPQTQVVFFLGRNYFFVNGATRTMEVTATLISNRTMIPIRAVSEAFGYDVYWDPEQSKVIVTGFGHTIELWKDNKRASVDGVPTSIDVAPTMLSGVMFVPVRFISESMGLQVNWYPSEAKVEVKLP